MGQYNLLFANAIRGQLAGFPPGGDYYASEFLHKSLCVDFSAMIVRVQNEENEHSYVHALTRVANIGK